MEFEKVGVQLYTLRELCKTPADIAKTFTAVSKIGYKCVQVSGIGPIDPKELRKIADDNGLRLAASHVHFDRLLNELPKVIEEHKIWGASQLAIPSIPQDFRSKAGYIEFAKRASQIGSALKKEGITLSYHNHAFEFEKFDGKTGFEILYENSDPEFLKAELDTYWVQYGGGDVVFWCKRLSGRLVILHAKDYGIKENQPTFMEIGEGNLNWQGILTACKDAATEWIFIEQDRCNYEPLESVRISFENMKRMFKEYNL